MTIPQRKKEPTPQQANIRNESEEPGLRDSQLNIFEKIVKGKSRLNTAKEKKDGAHFICVGCLVLAAKLQSHTLVIGVTDSRYDTFIHFDVSLLRAVGRCVTGIKQARLGVFAFASWGGRYERRECSVARSVVWTYGRVDGKDWYIVLLFP